MTATTLAGIPLATPILAASGCAGTGRELGRTGDLAGFGAFITRSITAEPRAGRPAPRLQETPSGLLNAIGMPGPGVEAFLEQELPWLAERGITVIVSITGESAADFARLAQRLRQVDAVAGVEVNLSNPVQSAGTRPFAHEAGAAGSVIHAVRRNTATGVPVLAKLAGDVTDLVAVARACVTAGADGLSLINAVRGFAVDTARRGPALGSGTGGLSGPAIRPIALRAVWETHAAMPEVPIVGSGGVTSGDDAVALIMAGATAVSVGTALLSDPSAGARIQREVAAHLVERSVDVAGLIGCAHRGPEMRGWDGRTA
jgi:dihydroorotate dehydrogenase (NAD+) catalytic subunit